MNAARAVVLAVNAGSSSLKFGLYDRAGVALWIGAFEGLEPGGTLAGTIGGKALDLGSARGESAFDQALDFLMTAIKAAELHLAAVSHRIVHGGETYRAPILLDDAVLTELHKLDALAPLHQPHNLLGVSAFLKAMPDVPQFGCFDTAFHATLPDVESRLPIDRNLTGGSLRRYGFHGLSYHYVSKVMAQRSPRFSGRAVLAHLGNGASVCATLNGKSVATSMGFSTLEGLMMGSRSGSIDPGVLLYLWEQGWSHAQVEALLYRNSGLKGVSGICADMRVLRASKSPAAQEAIALFTQRLKRECGAMLAVMGGVDVICFTGGIGEHDAVLRREICAALGFAGVVLDEAANLAATGAAIMPVHAARSGVEVWVVPTDEGRVAADSAFAVLEA